MRTALFLILVTACTDSGELTASRTGQGFGCADVAFGCGWEAAYQADGTITLTSHGNTVETRVGTLTDRGRSDLDGLVADLPGAPTNPDFFCADIPVIDFTVRYDSRETVFHTMREGCEPTSAATKVGNTLGEIERAIIDRDCSGNPRVICAQQ